jgi:hypothetical protein
MELKDFTGNEGLFDMDYKFFYKELVLRFPY